MMDWMRWHNGTVTDPKLRVIARRAGVSIPVVIAVWAAVLENANQAPERGTVFAFDDEDVAAAFDIPTEDVVAVREAMQGKTLDGDRVRAWEKRNPKREREDSSTDRVRRYREKQAMERHETPGNALDKIREDKTREETTTTPLPSGSDAPTKSKKKKAVATSLPEDWEPNEKHRALAEREGLDVDREAFRFKQKALAKNYQYANWNAGFSGWLTNDQYRSTNGKTQQTEVIPLIREAI